MEVGTLKTKSRRQQWRERPEESADSLKRAWLAVNKARMVFGLAGAPIFPCAVFWIWAGLQTDIGLIGELILTSFISTALGMCWFIGVGSLFLTWLGRRYGVVERFNCLALCATLTFSMPLVSAFIGFGIGPLPDVTESLGIILASAISGLTLAPLGMIGGWVLWRIAIRPAARPLQEIAEVF
jgi:hypothetical protein